MQKHHAAREVFLTQQVDNNDVESLWRPAQVCLPDAAEKTLGDDVFICEYEYDTVWQVHLLAFPPWLSTGHTSPRLTDTLESWFACCLSCALQQMTAVL